MEAKVKTLSDLLGGDICLLVPHYQRPYVWNEDDHWEPLWEDIMSCHARYQEGEEQDHFLGAIVLKQEKSAPGEPARHTVIDGQQRLTTTQILLSAVNHMAQACDEEKTARQMEKLILNDPDVATGEDRFKLTPTRSDRNAFQLVADHEPPPVDAEDDDTNTIQEAYEYFQRQIGDFAVGDASDPELTAERLDELRVVIGHLFKFVAISLEGADDAQVIFETLNARGTPLLALDLVKNAVFLEVEKGGQVAEELHDDVWQPELGLPYWREEVRQGRLTRPRAELFLMHWMTMKLALSQRIHEPIRSDQLFKVFGAEFLKSDDFDPVELVQDLVSDAKTMREFDEPDPNSLEGRYFRTTEFLDSTLFLPIVLYLHIEPSVTDDQRIRGMQILESFQLRRALVTGSGKSYSQLVIELLRLLGRSDEPADNVIAEHLAGSFAARSFWPRDEDLRTRLEKQPIYGWVSRHKVTGVLTELEIEQRTSSQTEDVFLSGATLSIEHILPQKWKRNWPLADDSPLAEEERNEHLHLLGNLTLATGSLNSAMSNEGWEKKRERLSEKSLLLMNREIASREDWDEEAIEARGRDLASRILELWPGPETFAPGSPLTPEEAENGNPDDDEAPWNEWSPMSPDEALEAYENGTELFSRLMLDLAEHADSMRSFGEVEGALGWPTGRLASVLGGFSAAAHKSGRRRPFRIRQDHNGIFWIWMDADTAEPIRDSITSES